MRKSLSESPFSIVLKERHGFYYLGSNGSCEIRIPSNVEIIRDRSCLLLEELRGHRPMAHFSSKDVAKILGYSLRFAIKLVNTGVERGTLEKSGRGRYTCYRFCVENIKKAA